MNPLKNESKTITGAALALVSFLLAKYGGFSEDEAAMLVLNLLQVGGVLLAWYGRVKAGGVNWLGRRTNK